MMVSLFKFLIGNVAFWFKLAFPRYLVPVCRSTNKIQAEIPNSASSSYLAVKLSADH
jgi:hypothetical protein